MDLRDLLSKYDKKGMLKLVEGFANQLREGWDIGCRFAARLDGALAQDASRIVVCGMGGSAIGGDLIGSTFAGELTIPVHVSRDYRFPAHLKNGSLFVISSYSGNTGETLSSYDALRDHGTRIIAVTTGGKLAGKCEEDGVPCCIIPGGLPPRAAFAYSYIVIARILKALGVITLPTGDFEEAQTLLSELCRSYSLEGGGGEAAELAHECHGRVPYVYACEGLLGTLPRRWCAQFNENSKVLAHHALFPELCHNEIVGWEVLKEEMPKIVVISLEDKEDHPMSRKQAEITLGLIKQYAGKIVRFESRGNSTMARVLSLLILGDFTSVYLALLNNVDPTPVEKIDFLKSKLTEGSA